MTQTPLYRSSKRQWREPKAHEALLHVYLRLAGYFTTGFICHAPRAGTNLTELDCIAIRHPFHTHPDIDVKPPKFLSFEGANVDLLLCESKSDPAQVRFNPALKTNSKALELALRWSGLIPEATLQDIVIAAMPLFADDIPYATAQAGIVESGVRIRALLSCPRLPANEMTDRWCLNGGEIFRFASECLRPAEPRADCATRYNFEQWGWLTPIVKYIKDGQDDKPPTLDGMHEFLRRAYT